ncbi:MAG TPA: hypothetical protein P5137_13585 [Candidatus Brocadiia bacterium]|nr:hypothetical protein [Candidatus Brocadiia bacterium]
MSGISLNFDNTHFVHTRGMEEMTEEALRASVDLYAGTQVREIIFCVNAQRASFDSAVWESWLSGFDAKAGPEQPLLAPLDAKAREALHSRLMKAAALREKGIDLFACLLARAREKGLSAWLSMRMNDMHFSNRLDHPSHSTLWRTRPDLWRAGGRPVATGLDRAFDYAQPEVFDHHFALVREIAERFDFDGLELDWSRHFHFLRPGHELTDAPVLTRFVRQTRELLRDKERRAGRALRLGVRVPETPRTACGLGMDAVRWAREGLVDMIVPTPQWYSTDFNMPVAEWKEWLDGTGVLLGAGFERAVQPHLHWPHGGIREQPASAEVVRGAAATFLQQGADRVYLFNYFDRETSQLGGALYSAGDPGILAEIGDLDTLAGKPRRHLVTHQDVLAPGEPPNSVLPLTIEAPAPGGARLAQVRLMTGPRPTQGRATIFLGFKDAAPPQDIAVYVNGRQGQPLGEQPVPPPAPAAPPHAWALPLDAFHDGYNLLEILSGSPCAIVWVEARFDP